VFCATNLLISLLEVYEWQNGENEKQIVPQKSCATIKDITIINVT
jgi:hypothetical protein